jgi:hypothetical protein
MSETKFQTNTEPQAKVQYKLYISQIWLPYLNNAHYYTQIHWHMLFSIKIKWFHKVLPLCEDLANNFSTDTMLFSIKIKWFHTVLPLCEDLADNFTRKHNTFLFTRTAEV